MVWEIPAGGSYQVIHQFGATDDGFWPVGNVTIDAKGDLISTTSGGGIYGNCGIVWKMSPSAVAGFTFSSSSVPGGASVTGTVTLHGYSPADGISVNIYSTSAAVSFPGSVYVEPGARATSFTVTAKPTLTAATASFTASVVGYPAEDKTAKLDVEPTALTGISLSQASVFGGTGVTGKVTLSGPAPSSGFKVVLKSSSGDATAPASVQVAAGATTATFSVTTKAVAATVSATITASLGSVSKNSTLTVETPLHALTVAPDAVTGGTSAVGTLTLTAAAPSGGLTVTLETTASGVASAPQSVFVAGGATAATFIITTFTVTKTENVTVKAVSGLSTQSATIKVKP